MVVVQTCVLYIQITVTCCFVGVFKVSFVTALPAICLTLLCYSMLSYHGLKYAGVTG